MRSDDGGRDDRAAERASREPAEGLGAAALGDDEQLVAESEAEPTAAPQGVEGSDDEVQELRDRYLRLAAEYDNYRKRTDRERLEMRDRAQAHVVERLLEPLDDLQRVAHFSPETATVEALLEGVRMVERKLLRVLETAGLEVLDARGQRFDPTLHDALMMAPTDLEEEDDTVGEVFQPGYRFRGSLLRPARVQVKKHGG